MAVFRVEKNKGYTVMSNHHLRNKELSLKAKGLLSQMLSLPEDWDYTLAGLSLINRESIDAIRTAVWELEKAGYITRRQGRDEKGKMTAIEYTIYEQPQPPALDCPVLENPTADNPILENPTPDNPTSENPTQLNKEIQKTNLPKKEKLNTDISSTHSIPFHSLNPSPLEDAAQPPERKRKEATDAYSVYEEIIKDNIEYDYLIQDRYLDRDRIEEILALILETVCTKRRTIRIAGDDHPAELVKAKFMKLNSEHIRFVLDCMQENTTKMDKNYIIETKNLTKQYGSQKSVADLNIHVQKGRIYGLLGRNGAGKTTTMKMLLGLTKPTSGEVKIWGKSLQGNEKKLLPRIGSLIESPGFYPNLTATENLQIFATLRGIPNRHSIKNTLDLVGLPYKDKKLFSQYSLGMKQRLAIALAVMHDPELLILDEPINGLDPIGIAEVRSFIRELCDTKGKTILISSHILSEISLLADDIGIIDHGALLEEESLAELEQKSSKHIRFTLSDTAQAARILERTFHESHFSIQDDHNLRLHNLDLSVGKIVTAFVENGLEVSEAHTCEESLEDYFKRVTGGEGIA